MTTTRSAATSPRSTAARSRPSATRPTARVHRRDHQEPHLVQRLLRRGRRVMVAGELPPHPDPALRRARPGQHRRQRHPGQPRQRRRRRHPAAADQRLAHLATNPGTISITNNTIANNVSAHEGGGIALDDAAFVNIVDNTVAKNLTTATAVTSDGTPAPAGLSTAANSDPLQARLSNALPLPGLATLAATHVQQADAARQRVLGQPRRQLQRRLRLRHRWHAARRHRRRREQLGHGRRRRPGGLLTPTSSVLQTTDGTDVSATTPQQHGDRRPRAQGPVRRCRSTSWPRGPTPRSGRPSWSPRSCRPA